jgi:hypothetical protein
MYAVIRRYRFDPNNSEEINRRVRDAFVHLLRKTPGFEAYYWLDTGEGEGASLSVFRDKAGGRNRLASPQTSSSSIWHRCWESRRSYRAKFMPARIAVGDVQLLLSSLSGR